MTRFAQRRSGSPATPEWRRPLLLSALVFLVPLAALTITTLPDPKPPLINLVFQSPCLVIAAEFSPDGQSVICNCQDDLGPERQIRIGLRDASVTEVLNRREIGAAAAGAIASGRETSPPGSRTASLQEADGRVLFRTTGALESPRVSPDGRRVAFLERAGRGALDRVRIASRDGNVNIVSSEPWNNISGLSWSPSGREVWFSAGTFDRDRSIYALNLHGGQRRLLPLRGDVTVDDVSAGGTMLFHRIRRREAIRARRGDGDVDLFLSDVSELVGISRDGRTIVSTERWKPDRTSRAIFLDGHRSVPCLYVQDVREGSARLMSEGTGLALSPDDRKILYRTATPPSRLSIIGVDGKADPVVAASGIMDFRNGGFFPDGRTIYYEARLRTDGQFRVFVQPLDQSRAFPVTPPDWKIFRNSACPDERRLVVAAPDGGLSLVDVTDASAGPAKLNARPGEIPLSWSRDGASLVVAALEGPQAQLTSIDVATGRRSTAGVVTSPDHPGRLRITSLERRDDGRALAVSYQRDLSDLYTISRLE